jgi:hypothetical protein
MRRHACVVLTAFFITAEIVTGSLTANAQQRIANSTAAGKNGSLSASRVRPPAHLEQALQDTIRILSNNNPCSRFFGDTKTAAEVLPRLTSRFEVRLLRDSRIGIKMSGTFTYFGQTEKHGAYRLFDAVTINMRGPFLKAKVFPAEPSVPPVGGFRPNTREARVLMLLHELAHLVKGQDGNWLVPDDGDDPALSKHNTDLIESQCRAQILSLS